MPLPPASIGSRRGGRASLMSPRRLDREARGHRHRPGRIGPTAAVGSATVRDEAPSHPPRSRSGSLPRTSLIRTSAQFRLRSSDVLFMTAKRTLVPPPGTSSMTISNVTRPARASAAVNGRSQAVIWSSSHPQRRNERLPAHHAEAKQRQIPTPAAMPPLSLRDTANDPTPEVVRGPTRTAPGAVCGKFSGSGDRPPTGRPRHRVSHRRTCRALHQGPRGRRGSRPHSRLQDAPSWLVGVERPATKAGLPGRARGGVPGGGPGRGNLRADPPRIPTEPAATPNDHI